MKKIITAIGNSNLNEKLMQNEKYEVISKDIQYKEGILEFLNVNSYIDILIISELLDGEIEFKELIERIIQINENIEIIVFLDGDKTELKSFLFSKGISKIYINNEIDIDTFIISLEDNINQKTNELTEEIKKLKEIIKSHEKENEHIERKGKIIAITGAYSSGKSTVACLLCKRYSKLKRKTLLIDFDIFNSSINIIYDVFKYNQNVSNYNLEEHIININKSEDLLCAMDLIYYEDGKVEYRNLEDLLNKLKTKYDEIIIDTTSNYKYKYLKSILNLCDEIIFIVVPKIIEIKKAMLLYEIYTMDFNINNEKFKFLINKENKYSIDDLIITNMFNKKRIYGKIKYYENIENLINNKSKRNIKINLVN